MSLIPLYWYCKIFYTNIKDLVNECSETLFKLFKLSNISLKMSKNLIYHTFYYTNFRKKLPFKFFNQ